MATCQVTQRQQRGRSIQSRQYCVALACTATPNSGMPRRITKATYPSKRSNAKPLHFVNADADSLGAQDTRRRTRDVKSYLSGDYRKWKRQQTLEASTSTDQEQNAGEPHVKPAPSAISTHASPLLSSSSSSQHRLKATSTAVLAPRPASKSPTKHGQHRDESRLTREILRQNAAPAAFVSATLRNALSHGNSDPFGVLPLPVDARTNMYIQLFHSGTTATCWTTTVAHRMITLLHNEALMHGVLAVSKIIAAVYLPIQQDFSLSMPESRQHYVQLLRVMRVYFENRIRMDRDVAIEMMHAAAMFTFLAREYAEFDFHLISLSNFVNESGGLQAVHPEHRARILDVEQLRALFLLKPPPKSRNGCAAGPWCEHKEFRPLDPFYNQIWSALSSEAIPVLPIGRFQPLIRELFLDYRDMFAAGGVGAILSRTKQPGLEAVGAWMGLRCHTLSIKLATVLAEINKVKQVQPSPELSLDAAACLAVSFLTHLVRSSLNPTYGLSYVPFATLIQYLREVAEYVDRGEKLYCQHLYLWTLFIGACAELASRTWSCDPVFRGSSWCSVKLAYMIEKLDIDTMQDLRSRLRQYVFSDYFDSYLYAIFNKRHELIKLSIENLALQRKSTLPTG